MGRNLDNVRACSNEEGNLDGTVTTASKNGAGGFINCMFFNARSLLAGCNFDQLVMLVSQHNLDVVGVCETWLNSNISDSELSLPGFKIFRKDRDEIREGKVVD